MSHNTRISKHCLLGTKGTNYPNVTIGNPVLDQGVERSYLSYSLAVLCITDLSPMRYTESGNMLIMTYAYARASGDGSLISKYARMKLHMVFMKLTKSDSILC